MMSRPGIANLLVIAILAGGIGYLAAGIARGANAESPHAFAAPPKLPNQVVFPNGAPQLKALKIETAAAFPLPLAEALPGRIAYNEDLTARIVSPVAGRILKLNAAAGDRVGAGTILALIDAPDLTAAIAQVQKANAEETRKKLAIGRSRKLLDAEVIPRKDLETAEAEWAQARAEVERAHLRLRMLSPHGDSVQGGLALRAPISGTVSERRAYPAMEVLAGQELPLFVVSDLSRPWVIIDLPERLLSRVRVGLPVDVRVGGQSELPIRAWIARIGEVMSRETRRIQVRCDLAVPSDALKPEMFAKVSLLDSEGARAVRLPNNALVTEGLYTFAFVEVAPNAYQKRKVELAAQEREYSYVRAGVNAGERVVTAGALLLQSELTSVR